MITLKTDYEIMDSIQDNLNQIAIICHENNLNFAMGYAHGQIFQGRWVPKGYWLRIFNPNTKEKLVDLSKMRELKPMLVEGIFEYISKAKENNRKIEMKVLEECLANKAEYDKTSVIQNNPYEAKEEKISYTFFPFDKEGVEILQEFINITKRNMNRNRK